MTRHDESIFSTDRFPSRIEFGVTIINLKNEKIISILPFGKVKRWVLGHLENEIDFNGYRVELHHEAPIPPDAFSIFRKQYSAKKLLEEAMSYPMTRILGITEKDLYVKELNFVFGLAELKGSVAVISTARLGMADNKQLFLERTLKEANHELGHTFGLKHCKNAHCVMHFSNSLEDTDKKSDEFCIRCAKCL